MTTTRQTRLFRNCYVLLGVILQLSLSSGLRGASSANDANERSCSQESGNVSRDLASILGGIGGVVGFLVVLLGLVGFGSSLNGVAAEGGTASLEYKVKAAFLLNFARFVEWPDSSPTNRAPLVIGVVGEDPFAETLPGTISGQTAQGRTIEIRYLSDTEPADNLVACHILFVSRSINPDEQKRLLEKVRGRPVLTISDREHFIRQGGMVGFVLVDKRVRFDINLRATTDEHLVLSSRLLNVANTVIK